MSVDNSVFKDDLTKIRHDIECLSNDIKFLIPKLITKIEYNKIVNNLSNPLNLSESQLEEYLEQTKSFVSHLESYCKSR